MTALLYTLYVYNVHMLNGSTMQEVRERRFSSVSRLGHGVLITDLPRKAACRVDTDSASTEKVGAGAQAPNRTPATLANAAAIKASDHAALRLASISLRSTRSSAIWMALSAAPLRRLSDTHHSTRPFSTVGSSRTREM
jgi:hypothetical protein